MREDTYYVVDHLEDLIIVIWTWDISGNISIIGLVG